MGLHVAAAGSPGGGPLVPVGDINRDQKASTRQKLAAAEVFILKLAGLGVLGVNLGCY